MKPLYTIIFFLFIGSTFFSQQIDSIQTERIRLGITYSPDYCYRIIVADNNPTSQSITEWRDSIEIPKFGYTTGINLFFPLTDRLSVETGAQFSKKGEKTNKIDVSFINSPGGSIQPINIAYNYHYYYLDVPLKINYYILKKPAIFISGGLSANLFLQEKINVTSEHSDGAITTSTSTRNSELNMINLAGMIGIGFESALGKKLLFRIEPIFRHSITSIIDAPIKGYSYSLGMNFGLIYKL